MRRFAEDTKVPVEQSRAEIEKLLHRYGAIKFAYAMESTQATIIFEAKDRRVRFVLPLLHTDRVETAVARNARERDNRRRWRALLLCIKAKLESVASEIENFEEAFLAHIIMPDGKTVAEHTVPMIASSYKGGKMMPLLQGPAS